MLHNYIEVRRLTADDHLVANQIVEILRQTYNTGGGRFFIYHDLNYPVYLMQALQNKKDFWLYYLWDRESQQPMGFAVLREFNECLFLNQIVIQPLFRGRNLSAYLLSGILESINAEFGRHAFEVFELETFQNNILAKNIYERWGMTSSIGKHWYDAKSLSNTPNIEFTELDFSLSRDTHRFLQLYLNDRCIGTVINNDRVRLNLDNVETASLAVSFLLDNFQLKDICLVTAQILPLSLLDSSITYSKNIQDLRHMLKNEKTPL